MSLSIVGSPSLHFQCHQEFGCSGVGRDKLDSYLSNWLCINQKSEGTGYCWKEKYTCQNKIMVLGNKWIIVSFDAFAGSHSSSKSLREQWLLIHVHKDILDTVARTIQFQGTSGWIWYIYCLTALAEVLSAIFLCDTRVLLSAGARSQHTTPRCHTSELECFLISLIWEYRDRTRTALSMFFCMR
jgi:hypothetical protein